MNTDIKLMITLAGKQRLLHLEDVIFTDNELAGFYLTALCKDERWDGGLIESVHDCAEIAYYCAFYVIKGRWPEAERLIASDAEHAYYYATDVIKGRWPEAECFLASDAGWACLYARDVIGGRFPEAERLITNSAYWQQYYNAFLVELNE